MQPPCGATLSPACSPTSASGRPRPGPCLATEPKNSIGAFGRARAKDKSADGFGDVTRFLGLLEHADKWGILKASPRFSGATDGLFVELKAGVPSGPASFGLACSKALERHPNWVGLYIGVEGVGPAGRPERAACPATALLQGPWDPRRLWPWLPGSGLDLGSRSLSAARGTLGTEENVRTGG